MSKTYLNWSSGKDACLALHKLRKEGNYSVDQLVTTVNTDFNRVSMHGLDIDLLRAQAKSLGLPLKEIGFPAQVSMRDYSKTMEIAVKELKAKDYTQAVFGDIFLEDLRSYRDTELAKVGINGIYPLWKQDSLTLLKEFLNLGYKAITVCVNAKVLDESFCGRLIDESFINDLPENVDPCGENGEFHTFVFDGPMFKNPVPFTIGEKVLRTYDTQDSDDNCFMDEDSQNWDTAFWYCDLGCAL